MATTVTTSQSWFSRLGSSFTGVLFGFLVVIGAVVLLFWNEGRAVGTYQSLKEGASAVVSVTPESIDLANEGKLIHFTGMASVSGQLIDTQFGVGGLLLKLHRTSEVYEWVEHSQSATKEKLGGGTETTTTYTYDKEWSENLADSRSFQEAETHVNPSSKLVESMEWVAPDAKVGVFVISEDLLSSLSGYEPFSTPIYYKTDAADPQIGGARISYEAVAPQVLSVIAKQTASGLAPYQTKNGRNVLMITLGEHAAAEMFADAIAGNNMMSWILRVVGIVLMFIGLRMILGVLPILASVIPFVGRIVGVGTSLIALSIALSLSLLVIAVAWFAYRPILSLGLFAGAILLILGFKTLAFPSRK